MEVVMKWSPSCSDSKRDFPVFQLLLPGFLSIWGKYGVVGMWRCGAEVSTGVSASGVCKRSAPGFWLPAQSLAWWKKRVGKAGGNLSSYQVQAELFQRWLEPRFAGLLKVAVLVNPDFRLLVLYIRVLFTRRSVLLKHVQQINVFICNELHQILWFLDLFTDYVMCKPPPGYEEKPCWATGVTRQVISTNRGWLETFPDDINGWILFNVLH